MFNKIRSAKKRFITSIKKAKIARYELLMIWHNSRGRLGEAHWNYQKIKNVQATM